jgi:hypothetical protein
MAANLNDLIKGVVGGPNLNDGMGAYFGVQPGITLNGAILKDLQGRGATSDVVNTAWTQYFAISWPLLVGTLQDKQKEFWKSGGFAGEP